MKKNISINISGIIFHIEEDGYNNLKKYLDTINSYFSSYEDSEEIIADIEGRIAEIFLSKLAEGKQAVTAKDVSVLIKTMGSVADFEALEEEVDFDTPNQKDGTTAEEAKANDKGEKFDKSTSSTYVRPDKLHRDLNRKVLGGVASGIGHYYNVDPLWIRVALLLFTLSGGFVILAPFGGLAFLAYFVMWAVTPGSSDLVEDKKLKKLYRDPDNRVLGGVSSGLSKYFDTDLTVIRIIFIVLFLGFGVGFLAYIILWIITPEANSITDKMQMKGEPVTLSNIDSNIKQKKEEKLVEKGEGAFTTVLLFPFRLVGKILSGISKAFSPLMVFLVGIIRVFTGSIISIVGLSVMFAMVVTAGVFLGIYSEGDQWFNWGDWGYLPYEIVHDTVPGIGIAFLLVAIFIPFLYVFVAGLTVIAKRKVMSSALGWSILGFWLISILGATATLPNIVRDFRDEGIYRSSEEFTMNEASMGDTVIIDINRDYRYERFERRGSNDFDLIELDLRGSAGDQFKLEKRIISRGRNQRDAEYNAEMIEYDMDVDSNKINFDTHYNFKQGGKFRAQELDLVLYIPENVPFQVKRGMSDIMRHFIRGYDWWEIYRNTWMFTDDGLTCLSCESDER
jgi:phage shock protein PspC (stress-responsive transcriptional regulator)